MLVKVGHVGVGEVEERDREEFAPIALGDDVPHAKYRQVVETLDRLGQRVQRERGLAHEHLEDEIG